MLLPAGVAGKVPVAAGLLAADPVGAEPLLAAAAAAAAAAARAAAAVLAALTLRYCMAADMALATRGGELWDSRASFSLRSLLSAESPATDSASPCKSVLCMLAVAASASAGSAGTSAPLLRLPLDICAAVAAADAAIELRLYSRALAMRAAASFPFGAPVLFAFMRCWKACMLRSANDRTHFSRSLDCATSHVMMFRTLADTLRGCLKILQAAN